MTTAAWHPPSTLLGRPFAAKSIAETETKPRDWPVFMRTLAATVCLSACVSAGTVEAPSTGSPQENRQDQATRACEWVPPAADYLAARFSGLYFMLPPAYSIAVPAHPGDLSDTVAWMAPDSSVFLISFEARFSFGDSSSVVAEGTCAVSVLSKELSVELQRVSWAFRPDTAFVGLAAVNIDSMMTLDVIMVARSAAERQRLLGVLAGFAMTPPSGR